MTKAEIIAHSKNKQGDELVTFVVEFPRIILPEVLTHRMFSRNSASSRAIPFSKMVKKVQENPFIPIAWQKSHKGMQGNQYHDLNEIITSEGHTKDQVTVETWLTAKNTAIEAAIDLNENDVTKQLCNRLLEPFMYHKVIITTGLQGLYNFFNLRCPQYKYADGIYFNSKKDYLNRPYEDYRTPFDSGKATDLEWYSINESQAEIHIQDLAEKMWDCYNESTPKELKEGEWHIPFGDNIDVERLELIDMGVMSDIEINYYKLQISTARCARISYDNFEGKDDYEADLKLFNRLKQSEHWSPFEHVAKCMTDEEYLNHIKSTNFDRTSELLSDLHIGMSSKDLGNSNYGWCRNYKGFIQLREQLD